MNTNRVKLIFASFANKFWKLSCRRFDYIVTNRAFFDSFEFFV